MKHLSILGAIACGASIGAILRYFSTLLCIQYFGAGFPFGTLLVNLLGSLGIGLVLGWTQIGELNEHLKVFLTIGLFGALTTFSTYSSDTWLLLQAQQWLKAILNIGLNTFLCLGMIYLGQLIMLSRI